MMYKIRYHSSESLLLLLHHSTNSASPYQSLQSYIPLNPNQDRTPKRSKHPHLTTSNHYKQLPTMHTTTLLVTLLALFHSPSSASPHPQLDLINDLTGFGTPPLMTTTPSPQCLAVNKGKLQCCSAIIDGGNPTVQFLAKLAGYQLTKNTINGMFCKFVLLCVDEIRTSVAAWKNIALCTVGKIWLLILRGSGKRSK